MESALNKFDKLKEYIASSHYKTKPIYGSMTKSILATIEIANRILTNDKLLKDEIDELCAQHILMLNQAFKTAYDTSKTRTRQHIINSFCILNDINYDPKKTKHIEQLATSMELNLILTSDMVRSYTLNIDKTVMLPEMDI